MIEGSPFTTYLMKPWMILYPVTLATAVPIVLAARSVVDKCPKDTVGAMTSECSCKCVLQHGLVYCEAPCMEPPLTTTIHHHPLQEHNTLRKS